MRPLPRIARVSASRSAALPRPTPRTTLCASVALAAAVLGACDGAPVEPARTSPLAIATAPAVGKMTMTAYHAAYPALTRGTPGASRTTSGALRPSLSIVSGDTTVFAASETEAYTTHLDRAAFVARGTVGAVTDFESFAADGVAMPGDPYTAGGVTYRSATNVVIAPPTFFVHSTAIFNNEWTPVAGTLDSTARYTMLGANLTVSSSDRTTSPVSVEITTNVGTYAFPNVAVPAAIDGFAFFGVTVTAPGEYITAFRFDTRGAGWAVGLDDVTVGHVRRPNRPPAASLGGPYHGTEGETLTFSAASSADPDGDAMAYAWDLDADGAYDDGTGTTASRTFHDNGAHTIAVKVTDPSGEHTTATAQVTIANAPPRSALAAPATVAEGTPIELGLSAGTDVDADVASLQYAFDCAGTGSYGTPGAGRGASCATPDDGARVVRGRVSDKDGGESEYTARVAVTNVAPTVGAVSAPLEPVQSTLPVTVSATFADPGSADTFTGEVRWDDDAAWEPATITGHMVTASRLLTAGVYTVTLRVRDDDGGTGERTAPAYVVVYEPTASLATGGGWIRYAGAACPTLCGGVGGRADFGLVAKDVKGGAPTGRMRFVFHAGALTFTSTSYDWIVVANYRAQYKGTATVNGRGSYGFVITATDDVTDRLRIKFWDRVNGDENDPLFDSGDVPLDKVNGNGSLVVRIK